MSNTVKILLAGVVIIAIAIFGYWYSTSGSPAQPASSLSSSSSVPAATGASSSLSPADTALNDQFLTLLLNMQTIKLDQSIFTDPAFDSLKDFSTVITPDPNPGRVNPFAPIGQDAETVAVSVTTNQPTTVTKNSATFSGSIPPGTNASSLYFEYGTTSATPLPDTTQSVTGNPTTGTFSFPITGLLPSTTYYVQAAAVINGTVLYGSVMNFVTTSH